MKPEVTLKYLSYISNKKQKGEEGFTLIELLVVVIIIGVLAAVALPNLLSQVGKARETEIKNAVGTTLRQEQAYHFEQQVFTTDLAALGVSYDSQYIDDLGLTANAGADATVTPVNNEAIDDGTRAYSGQIVYAGGNYTQEVCQSSVPATSFTYAVGCGTGNVVK